MNSLKNRGVKDILIACIDGLAGFTNAIEAVYPNTEIQQCIIHQIRNTTKFVLYSDLFNLLFLLDNQRPYSAHVLSSIRVKQAEKRHFSDLSLAYALFKLTL